MTGLGPIPIPPPPEFVAIDRLYECPLCGALRFAQTVLSEFKAASVLISTDRPECRGYEADRPHYDPRAMILVHASITRWGPEHG